MALKVGDRLTIRIGPDAGRVGTVTWLNADGVHGAAKVQLDGEHAATWWDVPALMAASCDAGAENSSAPRVAQNAITAEGELREEEPPTDLTSVRDIGIEEWFRSLRHVERANVIGGLLHLQDVSPAPSTQANMKALIQMLRNAEGDG